MLKKKLQKTVKIESRNVVETDTTSLCLLKKPTYRQHFRGRRSFNYAKRFSVFNQEIWQWNPHSNRPSWALRPPFYLASSLHPPHKPSPQLLIGRRPADGNEKTRKMVSKCMENCGIWFSKSYKTGKKKLEKWKKTDGKKKTSGFGAIWWVWKGLI